MATAKPVVQRDVTITRVYDAPRELVFSMWTDAKHLAKWWGPHGFTNPRCEADPRPGGKILIHMQAPDGGVHPMGGVYEEVVPHERIVFTSFVELPDGTRVVESHNTVLFETVGKRTKVTLHARAAGFTDHGAVHARRHGGRLGDEPRQARGHRRAAERQCGRRRSDRDPRDLRRRDQRDVRQGGRSRAQASRARRRDVRPRAAAAPDRRGQGRDGEVVRHLGWPDRLGDGRSRRAGRRRHRVRARARAHDAAPRPAARSPMCGRA